MTRVLTVSRVVQVVAILPAGAAISLSLQKDEPVANAMGNMPVISQVYGRGGEAGATYNHDFMEIFNHGPDSFPLYTTSIQYASATGSSAFGANGSVPLQGWLHAGDYYLVQLGPGRPNGRHLPTPDLSSE